ncbi:MAG TPA: SsrA-binding protein SmpB [bacterium]|nr:SsrA-binding protein SmpB [bacterium]
MDTSSPIKLVTQNRKARHDYHLLEKWEAGLVLRGTEVKSLRAGMANLKDSYARISGGEIFLYGFHISPYDKGSRYNHDPLRTRKLLLHKKEIRKLQGRVEERGLTLVPVRVYFKGGKAKVEIALARGKKQYDKRADIAKRDAHRDMERDFQEKQR